LFNKVVKVVNEIHVKIKDHINHL